MGSKTAKDTQLWLCSARCQPLRRGAREPGAGARTERGYCRTLGMRCHIICGTIVMPNQPIETINPTEVTTGSTTLSKLSSRLNT